MEGLAFGTDTLKLEDLSIGYSSSTPIFSVGLELSWGGDSKQALTDSFLTLEQLVKILNESGDSTLKDIPIEIVDNNGLVIYNSEYGAYDRLNNISVLN